MRKPPVIFALALIISGCAEDEDPLDDEVFQGLTVSSAPAGALKSINKCFNAASNNPANGTQVNLWDCNGSSAQTWTLSSDRVIHASGFCLDVTNNNQKAGVNLQLLNCNGSSSQVFRRSGKSILSAGGLCLDVLGGSNANGTRVSIWGCNGGYNQQWDFVPKSNAGGDACLPFSMASTSDVLNSSKKVFAHYFYPLPLSIDNLPRSSDYYTVNYLNPRGESDKFRSVGGLLRSVPLPVAPQTASNWKQLNMQREVRMAIARGINGFTFDSMSVSDAAVGGPLRLMLDAAKAVDSRFKIMLMPDMTGLPNLDAVRTIVQAVQSHPSVYRMADGRLVLAPFHSEGYTPAQWSSLLSALASQGIKVAFYPTFGSLQQKFIDGYSSISVALGNFGNPGHPEQLAWLTKDIPNVHKAGRLAFAGITPQAYRPADVFFDEASNSLAYRNAWSGAITAKADVIQIVTWNDFGESTVVAPYTSQYGDSGDGIYNLTGYYSTWYHKGVAPTMDHDVLYYFHRKEPTNAASPLQSNVKVRVGSPENNVELLAFLTAPGTISIELGGKTTTKDAPAGITSLRVPLVAGIPKFTLKRNGTTRIAFTSKTTIVGIQGLASGVFDGTYWSGSASSAGVCTVAVPAP